MQLGRSTIPPSVPRLPLEKLGDSFIEAQLQVRLYLALTLDEFEDSTSKLLKMSEGDAAPDLFDFSSFEGNRHCSLEML